MKAPNPTLTMIHFFPNANKDGVLDASLASQCTRHNENIVRKCLEDTVNIPYPLRLCG